VPKSAIWVVVCYAFPAPCSACWLADCWLCVPTIFQANSICRADDMAEFWCGAPCRRRTTGKCHETASTDGASKSGLIASVASVGSWLGGGTASLTADAWQPPHDAAATFQGNWLSHLDFSGPPGEPGEPVRLWTLAAAQAHPFQSVPQDERLPTDCSFREDMRLLAAGDVKGAAAAKQALEDEQRRLRRLAAGKT
jgi:Oxysterol-binding protein